MQDDTPFFDVDGTYNGTGPVAMSEDCLTLNVWTPCVDASCNLPVMVWIHGGSFTLGSSAQPYYDAAILADAGVVVVTLNYRLGVFGFLASTASVNAGFQDQQLALAWVRANVGFFGGNASSVTLFGESAGAHSVSAHLIAPGSQGLFQRAILQSGSIAWFPESPPAYTKKLPEAQYGGGTFLTYLGCTANAT
jgi:para-nitrobenzyl esterase